MLKLPKSFTIVFDGPLEGIIDATNSGLKSFSNLDGKSSEQTDDILEYLRFALEVEQMLGNLVSLMYCPKNQYLESVFSEWVAHSSHLGLKAKYDIVKAAIETESEVYEEIDRKVLDEDFRRLMKFRNAFTHGKLVFNHSTDSFWIRHFRGKPEKDELTAERWKKLEESILRFHEVLRVVQDILADRRHEAQKAEQSVPPKSDRAGG